MVAYFIFISVLIALLAFAEITRKKGFDKLSIRREVSRNMVNEGEEFKITVIIENNKWLPISFLLIKEKILRNLEFYGDDNFLQSAEFNYHTSRYNILWYERIKRSYTLKGLKRGTYLLKELQVSIGDIFGFYTSDLEMEDYVELLVYPKLLDLKKVDFNTTSLYGDYIIKRWIYRDPQYIKGIREYTIEDRMKDIHWKSSLKMNKLMVKDYDYTSEKELIIVLDVQCGNPYWSHIDPAAIERGISLGASLAKQSVKEGVPVGMWTNSQLMTYGSTLKREIQPSISSFKNILEMCARVDFTPRLSFYEFLLEQVKYFNKNSTYVIITSFLSDESIGLIKKLRKSGFLIKLIDISTKSLIPYIDGIEKLTYRGEA